MKKLLLLAVLCFTLAGCTTVFTHPTKTGRDFDIDRKNCEMYAKNELAARGATET